MDVRDASKNHLISSHMDDHVRVVTGAGGPKARVGRSRIRVIDVAIWHEKHGMSADEIVNEFPQISIADVYAAMAYYWDHRDELEERMARADALEAKMIRTGKPTSVQARSWRWAWPIGWLASSRARRRRMMVHSPP